MNTIIHQCARCTIELPENLMEIRNGAWFCKNRMACVARARIANPSAVRPKQVKRKAR
jgi:hypothetical protein